MRKRVLKILGISCVFAICTMSIITPMSDVMASANSAQSYWEGVDSMGAVITDTQCPIEVQHEKLTFDIPQFPSNYYDNIDDFLAYNAKVMATYTFYNPADYTVKARLVFPFGNLPYYGYGATIYNDEVASDIEKYDVTVNGQPIEKNLRYTLFGSYGAFNIIKSLPMLGDKYVEDDFYSPNMEVTKYTYEISGLPEDCRSAYVSLLYEGEASKTRIWMNPIKFLGDTEDGARLGAYLSDKESLEVYVFGEPLSEIPAFSIYKDAKEEENIDGARFKVQKTETMTFEEFVFTEYFGDFSKSFAISQIDWYNATVYSMNDCLFENSGVIVYYQPSYVSASEFMRWYEYEIEIPAKSMLVNEVTAPLYPSIDLDWNPSIYGYQYLLSPAKTWSKFGSLDIEINTPYYIVQDEMGFEKTEKGYALSLSELPDGELEFTLSSSENPEDMAPRYNCAHGLSLLLLIPILPFSCIGNAVNCSSVITSCGVYAPILLSAAVLLLKKRK